MSESLFEKLLETSWRRKLTPAEEGELQTWLARHPEDAERWEEEASLGLALERLESVEPSSNFTSRVLQAVALEQSIERRRPTWAERFLRLFNLLTRHQRRVGWAATAVLLLAGLGYLRDRDHSQDQLARGMQSLSMAVAAAPPEFFEDFDAIQVLPELNQTDEALYVLLGQ